MLRSWRFKPEPQLAQAQQNKPPLARGAEGSGVAEMQDALHDLGFDLQRTMRRGRADGIFGAETLRAIQAFQKGKRLKADGIAGRQTITTLDEVIAKDSHLDAPPPNTIGASHGSDLAMPYRRRSRANW